jgi:type IV pilus assembly protein PilV
MRYPNARAAAGARGFSMIEVLISIIIIALGLLGLAGLQARMTSAETESYQRSQALILVEDMVNRIRYDEANALLGAYDTEVGNTTAEYLAWKDNIAGVSAGVTSLIGGKGCLLRINPGATPVAIRVSVAWQGLSPTVAPLPTQDPTKTPPTDVAEDCGKNAYGDETLRRVASGTVVIIPAGS